MMVLLKYWVWKTLGQIISIHQFSGALVDDNPSIGIPLLMIDIGPKEVILDTKVLGLH